MTQVKRFFKSKRSAIILVVIIFAIICVAIGSACFQYYVQVQDTLKAENYGYLQEISSQISVNASKNISDNFSVLGTVAMVIKNAGVTSYEQIQLVAREQQAYWNYQSMLLIDTQGVAYDAYGNTVVLAADEYLREAVVGRTRSMSAAQLVNGDECIVFVIPVEDVIIGGTKMSAIAACYDLDTFDQILSLNAFGGQGYAHIIRADGTVVIRSSSKSSPVFGYNAINTISSATFEETDIDSIRADIENGRSGQAEFIMLKTRVYMIYTPLETEEWCLLTFVPASVVNEKSDLLLKITVMLCAFITLAFAALLTGIVVSFYRHKHKLEQIAYVDPVTGGNTIQRFYELARERLNGPEKRQYALVYMNIEKFKVLNEQFGRNACDRILIGLEKGISAELSPKECVGRLFADNFCVLAQYDSEAALARRFDEWYRACINQIEKTGAVWLPIILEFGVYVIENDTMPFPYMIDRAKLALRDRVSELRGKLRYAIYDEQQRSRLFREKQLEDMMEGSLENHEFQVYLQPKYRTCDENIDGAEALVRWVSTSEGMIYPDEFISLFEKNGFIIRLDQWVFEEVCRTLRAWLDSGLPPHKISVNCSRVNLKSPEFLDRYQEISSRYSIPPNLIEIEVTETVVFEDVEHLTRTIKMIQGVGYGCSMDDFGSGYSSLNLIQDIPLDVLKLDKIFFRNGVKDMSRTESVIGSVISMAQALSMKTVAEGVEKREQVDMLKRLGCDFIQGYYFAKPMPIAQFEELAFGKPVKKNDD